MKWSVKGLGDACLKQLKNHHTTVLQFTTRNHRLAADAEWDDDELVVRIDPHQGGLIAGALHEMLHFVLQEEMKTFDPVVEEVIIRRLEDRLVDSFDAPTTAAWRRALKLKMKAR